MLILTRKTDQGIVLDNEITVRVLSVDGERVKLGITAPPSVLVLREELCENRPSEDRPSEENASEPAGEDVSDFRDAVRDLRQRRAQ